MIEHFKSLSKVTIKGWHAKFFYPRKQSISERIKFSLYSDEKSPRKD